MAVERTRTQIAGASSQSIAGSNSLLASFTATTSSYGGETDSFRLTASSGSGSAIDQTDVTIKHRNRAPQAAAGDDQTVQEGSPVSLDAAFGSFDPDGDSLMYAWSQVSVNQAPSADAGADQTVDEGSPVTLTCSGSDPDADSLTYHWLQTSGSNVVLDDASSPTPSFLAPLQAPHTSDRLMFQCEVIDSGGLTSSDETQVTVRDINAPPDCSLAQPSPSVLWPPNHTFADVAIVGVTDPNDTVSITVLDVKQDEPTNGLGDGDSAPDAIRPLSGAVTTENPLRLRMERSGAWNGRVYRVSFLADDGFSGSCVGSVRVSVPRDRKSNAIDDGAAYDSTQP